MRVCAMVTVLFSAVLALAQDKKPAAREIPTTDLMLTFPAKPGKPASPTVITSADDLAKNEVVGKAADDLKKLVDFTKDKLLVFTWSGSGQDNIFVAITTAGDKKSVAVVFMPGKTFDLREHIRLYIVPRDVSVAGENDKPAVRTLDLKGVKFVHPPGAQPPTPTEIKSAEELTRATAFEDDASREAIKKQVDFTREKLVVFVWSGSGQDKLTPELKTEGKKTMAVFVYKAGATEDLRRHGLVFAVPRDAEVKK